jgi:hypothetical protein
MERGQDVAAAPPYGGMAEEWISACDAREALGVAERTLRKWAVKGRLRREFGPDGRPRYRRTDIARLQAETPPEPEALPAAPSPKAAHDTRRRPPVTHEAPGRSRRASPATGGNLADAHAREQQLREENAWLRDSLRQAQKAEQELRGLLLNAQRAERDVRTLLLQAHTTLQTLGNSPAPPARRSRPRFSPNDRRASPPHGS